MRWVYAILPMAIVAGAEGLDTGKIEEVTGLKGTLNAEEGVFKVTKPRADVKVSVDGWSMPPFMGLISWAAFQTGKAAPAMVTGDLVLFQDEVNPVMSVLFDAGLTVTALHNHFFFDEPRVFFMHISGEGTEEALARGVRLSLDKVAEIRATRPDPAARFADAPPPSEKTIDGASIEGILGAKGQAKDGMYKVVIGRTVRAACGCDMGKDMGVNTWAAFAGTPEDAFVDGDFAVLEEELDAVLRALRTHDVNIVAIHSHMSGEQPRMLFLHYWGRGASVDLANAVRAALDTQSK